MSLNDLENAVIRQAESMGYSPGSPEFEDLVMSKIVNPELKMGKAVRGPEYKCLRTDIYLTSIDEKWLKQMKLKSYLKWCTLNRGTSMNRACEILGTNEEWLRELGRQCLESGIGPDFSKMLDGTDNATLHAPHPTMLDDGCSGSAVSIKGSPRMRIARQD
jgi:hypothetical protein